MLNERPGAGAAPHPGFFALLTAQAWIDPDLADLLGSDKNAGVARFAGQEGLALPAIDAIEAFILPDNPVGRAEPLDQVHPLYASADSCGCVSDGCPTGPTGCCWYPTSDCSVECPTTKCSAACPTVNCSADCPTVKCTVNCNP